MGTSSARAALVASALTVFVHAGRVHADPVTFQRTTVTLSLVGAAFVVAGGPALVDLNRDRRTEIVFGSFDQNSLSFWHR